MNTRKTVYSNGYPFTDPLPENILKQLERIDNKRASCILIDGAVGTGKTTLAVLLMDLINKKKGKELVSLTIKEHPQLSLGGKEFTGCFRDSYRKGYMVVTYDEAGDFNRRGAIRNFNQMINRLFETYRGFKILVIICLPTFHILDSQLFTNQIPRMLIHITRRTDKYGVFKAYSLSNMNWIRYWYDKLPKGASHKCYGKVQPNFYGKFLNLSKEREKELDKLSTYGKKELLKGQERELKGIISYKEMAQELGKGIRWVKARVSELKIKHVTIIDRVKYFNKDSINLIVDYEETNKEKRLKK